MNRFASLVIVGTFVGFGCASQAQKNTMDPAPAGPEGPKILEKKAETPTGSGPSKSNCSSKGDVRVLDVREVDRGCELMYSKMGNDSIVATAVNNGTAHCEVVAEKIKSKLTDAGFACD
jgi:hypothetical protein